MSNNFSEEQLIDLFGKLDDKYVSLPLEEVVAKQIERETSGFEEDDVAYFSFENIKMSY